MVDNFTEHDNANPESGNSAADYQQLDGQIIYIGALSCMRHRGIEFTQLQQEGRLSFLILNEIDYITGDYLNKIKEAARVVVDDLHPAALNFSFGCQGALLSTDYGLLRNELEAELCIPVRIDENCHLIGFDHRGNSKKKERTITDDVPRSHKHSDSRRGKRGEQRHRREGDKD